MLAAFNPMYAFRFFAHNGVAGYLVLGAVFLVATGGEALYADLGHFGELPIQIGWFSVVAPSLLLNYFGQGALLLRDPGAADNPFYRLAPRMVALSAADPRDDGDRHRLPGGHLRRLLADPAGGPARLRAAHGDRPHLGAADRPDLHPAGELGPDARHDRAGGRVPHLEQPRRRLRRRGDDDHDHHHAPRLVVARRIWGWKLWAAAGVTAVFLVIDVAFFGANIVKVAQGGWFPLAVAAGTFVIFASWRRGRSALSAREAEVSLPPRLVIDDVALRGIPRTPGTAVFLTGQETGTPPALLHNLKHNRVVHDRNVFLTVRNEEVPHVAEAERSAVEDLGQGFYRVIARYGFMEDPDVPAVLRSLAARGIELEPARTTFFLSRSTVLSRRKGFSGRILDSLFIFMGRNAQVPTQFFRLPPNRVIEIGMQVEI